MARGYLAILLLLRRFDTSDVVLRSGMNVRTTIKMSTVYGRRHASSLWYGGEFAGVQGQV